MIPKFPHFKKLEIEDRKEIQRFIKDYPPYCDYNFVSLWSYDVDKNIALSRIDGNLVVKFRDYLCNKQFFSFLGQQRIISTTNLLLSYAGKIGLTPELKLIPEITIQADKNIYKHFKIKEDFDNHDYIVSTSHISLLKGEKFNRKHRSVKHFQENYPQHKISLLDLSDLKVKSEIIQIFAGWERTRGKKPADTETEMIALMRLLNNAHHFNLFALGIYHKKLVGFSISEITHKEYAIGHFMKANLEYKGIFETLYKYTAQHLLNRKINYINLEQDMGLPGLRKSKQLYYPINFLKKYIISPK